MVQQTNASKQQQHRQPTPPTNHQPPTNKQTIHHHNHPSFLEEELARRYRDAAPATLALLQERCDAAARDLAALDARVSAASDAAALRRAAMAHAAAVARGVREVLEGSCDADPAQHGLTTEEERARCGVPQWPGVNAGGAGANAAAVRPPNAGLRLLGGAAFERCLDEFQEAAAALRFPAAAAARDRVANALLARKGRDPAGGAARAAEDLARRAAREMLAPLLDAACARLGFVLRRAVDAAIDHAARTAEGRELLQPFTVGGNCVC